MQSFSRKSAIFLLALSAFVILLVATLDYFFHIRACKLCVYQRYPYVALFVFNIAWLLWGFARRYHRWGNSLLLLVNSLLPLYHMMVERGVIVLKCATRVLDSSTAFDDLANKSMCLPQPVFFSITFAELHLVIAMFLFGMFLGGWYVGKRA